MATEDHKPYNEGERARIEKAGGVVSMKRVDGDLAVVSKAQSSRVESSLRLFCFAVFFLIDRELAGWFCGGRATASRGASRRSLSSYPLIRAV